MISIERARQIIMENLSEPKIEKRKLVNSLNMRLAVEIQAAEPMPVFTNSAMDGYAIALAENENSPQPPFQLEIVGESRAGHPYKKQLQPGNAVTISTGAVVPEGTNHIIPVEVTSKSGKQVLIHDVGESGAHIRHQGEEIKTGEIIGKPDQKLTPVLITQLAGFGITEVQVFVLPTISIITTGEELVSFNKQPGTGQIRNSNQVFLTHFLNELGVQPQLTKHISDSLNETIDAIQEAAAVSDIIIVSGGVSVGPHDHVKAAAESIGFKRHFWKVAQKPGKPLYFATHKRCCLLGLPGNPVSVIMTSLVYLYPIIKTLSGHHGSELSIVRGKFSSEIGPLKQGRAKIFLVKIDYIKNGIAALIPVAQQQSHRISCTVEADGFTIIAGDKSKVRTNEIIRVYTFPWEK